MDLLALYFLFRKHHCGKEYLRKAFMNVNKEVKYVNLRRACVTEGRSVIGETRHFGPLGSLFFVIRNHDC